MIKFLNNYLSTTQIACIIGCGKKSIFSPNKESLEKLKSLYNNTIIFITIKMLKYLKKKYKKKDIAKLINTHPNTIYFPIYHISLNNFNKLKQLYKNISNSSKISLAP
jgi:hypothetical protein